MATSACGNAIVGDVKEPSPLQQFVDAVHALAEDPDPDNVTRYLAASRALEEPRDATGDRREERAA